MGQELNKPNINKKPIDGKTKLFRYGMNEIQGWKKTMDVFTIKENDIGPDKNINIFGTNKQIIAFITRLIQALSKFIKFVIKYVIPPPIEATERYKKYEKIYI